MSARSREAAAAPPPPESPDPGSAAPCVTNTVNLGGTNDDAVAPDGGTGQAAPAPAAPVDRSRCPHRKQQSTTDGVLELCEAILTGRVVVDAIVLRPDGIVTTQAALARTLGRAKSTVNAALHRLAREGRIELDGGPRWTKIRVVATASARSPAPHPSRKTAADGRGDRHLARRPQARRPRRARHDHGRELSSTRRRAGSGLLFVESAIDATAPASP